MEAPRRLSLMTPGLVVAWVTNPLRRSAQSVATLERLLSCAISKVHSAQKPEPEIVQKPTTFYLAGVLGHLYEFLVKVVKQHPTRETDGFPNYRLGGFGSPQSQQFISGLGEGLP